MSAALPLKKIRIIQLVAVIFFTVSGGPYGLEPLLTHVGEHGALLLLIVTPLFWDVPAILTVLELNSMMPVTGGYYKWVKYALGTRWGFFEGWWTWLYTFVDLAIYPGLFVLYASYFFPALAEYRIPLCLCVVWASAGLNILGIVPVGRTALFLGAIVFAPFIIMFTLFFVHHTGGIHIQSPSLTGVPFPSLGMGLYVVMWNCLGWDNVTTYAEEVDKPVKSYLVSVFTAFVLVIVLYVMVILVTQQTGISAAVLEDKGFPAVAEIISGKWLGGLIAFAGMASSLGIYAAVLLSVSRVPKVMADDDLLHKGLNRQHRRFQTPYVSIIVCSVIVSLMTLWKFGDLLIIDVTVYGAGLSLEYVSLIRLRRAEPDRHRPFKIPLGIPGLYLMILLPFTVYFVALFGAFSSEEHAVWAAVFAIVALSSAELVWRIIVWRKPYHKN
ncbi:APC family permease [Mucilaginibacter sp.]|uniref:APC family permease n=1 Tax=Mucilaginibacter sp. TaxID=1882438 RepID=UPI0025E5A4AD|nr:APC family permease [Mucilaginibacter sp.]